MILQSWKNILPLQIFNKPKEKGQMAEWLKAHAWKACVPQKGTEGSNPSLSAETKESGIL